ncbi:DUF2989 domain-containing protein [Vibrio sonorensis]|uniref:DUF2989 domain-containing protein n=1 Tax=Vibrio sonorensis TaxID=1004316 RepID=UPI0008DA4C9F|nr:DUF2989 domain-containing protein [Vibrio sonorensis]
MNSIKIILVSASVLALSGCFENTRNTEQLCNKNPGLRCELLNINDGQCRIPRTDLIWHRHEVQKQPTDKNIIKEFGLVSEYRKCLELAAQIQPIDQTDLKQRRFSALMHTGEELDRITGQLRQSTSPEALYFLWSQIGDERARQAFLRMEGKPQLDTAEMQYALATFYTSRDEGKTIKLLNRSLELSNGKNLNTEVFKSLASTYYQINMKEKAYIWAKVAFEFDVPIASEAELHLLYGFSKETYSELDDVADDVVSALKSGEFNRNSLKAYGSI